MIKEWGGVNGFGDTIVGFDIDLAETETGLFNNLLYTDPFMVLCV